MSDDGNVITLRPRGGGGPPGLPPLPGAPPATPPAPPIPPPPSAPPPPDEGSGAGPFADRERRSAADSLTALTPAGPSMPPAPVPGAVPATFRSEAPDDGPQGPGLGALSLSALLAVALAALRGTAGALQDWRQRRMEREAEAEPLRKARLKLAEARAGTDAATASAGGRGRVPSSSEWGSRAHRGGGSGGGLFGRGSGGGGKSSGSRAGTSSGSPSTSRGGGTTGKTGPGSSSPGKGGRTGSSSGSGNGAGSGKAGGGSSGSGSGSSSGGGRLPGTLGQLAMERARRRTARDAAADKRAGRQQKADLTSGKSSSGSGRRSDGGTGKVSLIKDKGKAGAGSGDGRVTLGKAIGDETYRRASDRLRARRDNPDAPFLSRTRKDTGGDGEEEATDSTEDGTAAPETAGEGSAESANGPETAADGPEGAKPGPGAASGPQAGGGWESWTPPPRGDRRSADEAMRDATDEGVTVTVEWPDRPTGPARPRTPAGAVSSGVRGLPRASHRPAGPRPGTTAPTKGTAVSKPAVRLPGHVPGVAAEHMTDVTLDDVLDHLADSRDRCFDTYDECARLAVKALSLRGALEELAEELRARHNIIGRLTAAAMALLADSMDLLARKAVEMRAESLKAAEAVELAHDEMHDAYRPVQQATADAGLHMPSARIHNED